MLRKVIEDYMMKILINIGFIKWSIFLKKNILVKVKLDVVVDR